MILISDSGSTKAEWTILSDDGNSEPILTSGINPFFQNSEDIFHLLENEFTSSQRKFDAIYFYGAGCTNQEKGNIIKSAISNFFDAKVITVGSDLLGAAHSLCQTKQGVACILGTGSNSCLYNGEIIVDQISPLGFILGDEGSGAVLGRKLIGDILKKQLPQSIIDDFFEDYPTTAAEILENVYKKPLPSRYLSNFTRFLSKNIQYTEIEQIVLSSFREFITRNLMQYSGIENTPINFTGSIAFHFEKQLRKVIEEQGLIFGKINQSPMKGLILYHQNNPQKY